MLTHWNGNRPRDLPQQMTSDSFGLENANRCFRIFQPARTADSYKYSMSAQIYDRFHLREKIKDTGCESTPKRDFKAYKFKW